ncbi:hypothetical protein [Dictyobacter formicarum]|uniref:Uncharacterized protein n=1 Tax=Dictyobacter formicarum TaxID=2778368 RepID=A0ABQ3VRT9_9CHLR|nr:hypothetical protein [Dictyobacter formicarum]GHO88543.1 hypothetical protein KSZ_65490 [Dictyobacter formicarum]
MLIACATSMVARKTQTELPWFDGDTRYAASNHLPLRLPLKDGKAVNMPMTKTGAQLWPRVSHLPTGLGTAPALISAGSQLGVGALPYLITGHGALVTHISANLADGWRGGGTAQHEIFAELADLGTVL